MISHWIRAKKAQLLEKWATEFGLLVVEVRVVAGTEYLVCRDGSMRRLARAGKRGKA